MRFRTGLAVGMAIGYVLGTRDGRERYEELQALARDLRRSEALSHLQDGLRHAWDAAQEEFPGAEQVGSILDLRERLGQPGRADG